MQIHLLHENETYIEAVAYMVYQEFAAHDRKMTYDDAVAFFSNTHLTTFPITLIAIIDGECAGTVSAFENDLKERPQYKPWLASLYVEPQYRNRKIGLRLMEALLSHVKALGHTSIYLKTENASDYYKQRGWTFIESVSDQKNNHVDIFQYQLV
ncbi:GNAT family N-acetyltransferase [Bacillus sonorensis]|uniref:N-acetyltransferase GCN5 n=2 Tax=Bacillus sonorensis TaxID=119858 RepID=M5NYY2_9BACI|nr:MULTISPECIES: GNAT family N-acetyltransferase [Bacillus]TWK79335.1 hypothetical protein CHCC20335_0112 [Bacillus paralicheniformis]ASB90679.1 hypothetical protein S101395_04177 [Bacillus sonorensis]EME73076.1 N-acetyltransferase GCN5 [Bacillus sonorensis L12]MBG9914085.1 N-acetyltransferase GCN5 [Bacillus sonorensis]MCY8086211.1 GNAT family N-acetyltransferase [Bacillus sonorensis]